MGELERSFVIVGLSGMVGFVLAVFFQYLYDMDILITKFVGSTFTLREIQVGVILVWLIVGIGALALDQ